MALPDTLHNAVKGLTSALDLLEAAVDRRVEAEAIHADRDQETALMQEDRARLGEELERSVQETERLRIVGAELGERLTRMDALCAHLQQRAPE